MRVPSADSTVLIAVLSSWCGGRPGPTGELIESGGTVATSGSRSLPEGAHATDDRTDGQQHAEQLQTGGVVRPAGHDAGDAEDEAERGEQVADGGRRRGPAH